jgi:hypothetical protein
MTRILLIVAMLLLVSPAMGVTITATDNGDKTVTIGYSGSPSGSTRVRAFALDITVSGTDVNITGISNFKVGESNATSLGYGIFPGKFRDFINPGTPNWGDANYNPVAPVGDPDSNDVAMPSKYITVELGSLYTTGGTPPDAGTLFKLQLAGTGSATLCVKTNATRGNVVNEDATEAAVTLPGTGGCISVALAAAECLPSGSLGYADWLTLGKPSCWCYPRQCHGDADGKSQGSTKTGVYWVGENDLNIFSAVWKKLEPPKGSGVASVPNGICADFARDQQGSTKTGVYRVGENDLNRFTAYWKKLEVPKGSGTPPDCGGSLVPP